MSIALSTPVVITLVTLACLLGFYAGSYITRRRSSKIFRDQLFDDVRMMVNTPESDHVFLTSVCAIYRSNDPYAVNFSYLMGEKTCELHVARDALMQSILSGSSDVLTSLVIFSSKAPDPSKGKTTINFKNHEYELTFSLPTKPLHQFLSESYKLVPLGMENGVDDVNLDLALDDILGRENKQ